MDVKLHDKVLLKSGETAHIVEIYKPGVSYEAVINKQYGDNTPDMIKHEDIEMVIE